MGVFGYYDISRWWRKIKPLRDAYRKKLIDRGVHPLSPKMSELMDHRFPCPGCD